MSEQIDKVSYTIELVREAGGAYTRSITKFSASCSDPAATDPTGKAPRSVEGIVAPAYDGAETNDVTGTAFLDASKTAAGIP